MNQIVIETTEYSNRNEAFTDAVAHRFPMTAKGLSLAVIAAERMTLIDPYHRAYADIRIIFKDGESAEQMDDAQLFDLMADHRHHFSILEKCQAIMNRRTAASIERRNKLAIARAAVEDLVEAGFALSWENVYRARNVDEIMEAVAANDLAITFVIHTPGHVEWAGYVTFEDGRDHEIFASRSTSLDEYFDRAFGLINEANDNGEISDFAA